MPIDIQKHIDLHTEWRCSIERLIKHPMLEQIPERFIKDPNKCALGQDLLKSEFYVTNNDTQLLMKLNQVHTEFHQKAAEIIRLWKAGEVLQASESVNHFYSLSDEIIQILEKLK